LILEGLWGGGIEIEGGKKPNARASEEEEGEGKKGMERGRHGGGWRLGVVGASQGIWGEDEREMKGERDER